MSSGLIRFLSRQQISAIVICWPKVTRHIENRDFRGGEACANTLRAFFASWQTTQNQTPPAISPFGTGEDLPKLLMFRAIRDEHLPAAILKCYSQSQLRQARNDIRIGGGVLANESYRLSD
jgi:hypothetical protein